MATVKRTPKGPAGPQMVTRAKAAELEARAEHAKAKEAEAARLANLPPEPPPVITTTPGIEFVNIKSETLAAGIGRVTSVVNFPHGCIIRVEMRNKRHRGMGVEQSESMCFVPGVSWDGEGFVDRRAVSGD